MRILFLTPAFPPFPGGGERYVRSLGLALHGQGHEMVVVTSSAETEPDLWQGKPRQDAPSNDNGLTVLRAGLNPMPLGRNGLMAWRKSMVLLSELPGDPRARLEKMAERVPPIAGLAALLDTLPPPDVIHGFNISWEHAMLVGRRTAQRQKRPFFATPFAHLGVAGRDRVARNSTMRHQLDMLHSAETVFTLTEVEREGLMRFGVAAERLTVAGSGVDAIEVDWHSAELTASLPTRFVLFVGRNSFEKGAIHAAEAVAELRRQGEAIALVLVGQSTAEFDAFMQRISAEARAGIVPLGIVSEAQKHALLDRCEMLLLPSRTDSLGIVLLEAWQHAKPVIGAEAGGIPGVVDPHQNGLLVPFGDVEALQSAIQQLLNDDEMRHDLGRAGQQKLAESYTWQAVATRTLAAYRRALGTEAA